MSQQHPHRILPEAVVSIVDDVVTSSLVLAVPPMQPMPPMAETDCSTTEVQSGTGAATESDPSYVSTPNASTAALEINAARRRMLPPTTRRASQESVHSADELGNSCRICRWNRSDMEIINCPCNCKGSVGFIHLKCLKRWIMHRRDNRCEICHTVFDISEERVSFKHMIRTFCCGRCCGLIVKHLLFSASLMPLAHIILQQVLQCMDNLNQGSTEQLTVQEVFVASCALLTSSALFFHFFEFVTTRCLLIRNILRHWWMFGSTSDFALVELEDDTIDLF
ncbi:hypothetical protein KR018_005866 [Drosophila ironensis]|nr:hypothetical protein KR018_005866 [Drosophila ironensis]